jgi:tetratricopeptide (TPR) repeat protein
MERELARNSRDPWLWSVRGMRLLREGRPDPALGDLARALALGPRKDREVGYAWALLARGGPAARIWEARRPMRIHMVSDIRERVLRGIYLALEGRRTEAAAIEVDALQYRRSSESAGNMDVAAGSPLPEIVLEIISSWPAARRPAVIDFFATVPGFEFVGNKNLADAWLDLAARSEEANQRPVPSDILAFTEGMRLDAGQVRKLARDYRDRGDYSRALTVLKRTKVSGPDDADLLLDIASRAAGSGRRSQSLESLAFAESMDLDSRRLRSLAVAYREIGGYARALAVLKRTDMSRPEDADLLLDNASRAARSGQIPAASASLAFAETLSLDQERLRRLALAYQDLGRYSRALDVMKRTDMRGAKDVYMLLDLAARAARDSQRPAALSSLAFVESRAADPAGLRTLALAYRDLGEYARAIALLKRTQMSGAKDLDMLLDLSVRAARDGRRPAALASLSFAESLKLDQPGLRSLSLGYRSLGDSQGVARVRRRMGDEDGLELDRAEAALAAGDGKSAQAHLSRVRDASLVDPEARRLVLLYQGLGKYPAALEVVKRRVLAAPGDAQWRNDSGVLHSLLGERELAAADWNSAIALSPDSLSPYLSLGTLYASLNRPKEALDLYHRALSRRTAKEDSSVLRRILEERSKLLASPSAAPRP